MAYDPLDPEGDPFGPPAIPTEVCCLHCGEIYESYLIEWRIETTANGKPHGFWCCPTPGCGGVGFGCDILPTDPTYQDEYGGWIQTDEEEEEFEEEDELGEEELDGPSSTNDSPDAGKETNGRKHADDDEDIPW